MIAPTTASRGRLTHWPSPTLLQLHSSRLAFHHTRLVFSPRSAEMGRTRPPRLMSSSTGSQAGELALGAQEDYADLDSPDMSPSSGRSRSPTFALAYRQY